MEICLKQVKKKYGKHTVIDDFDMKIESGKITCIYGVSGSGKTTLLNIIGLIDRIDSGSITYDGHEIKNSRQRRKMLNSRIGFIFQDFGLMENETVYRNLLLVRKIKKLKNRKEAIVKVLDKLDLEGFIDRKVFELSGGEQQRVAIAKIILKDIDLVLADEPTASLDDFNKQVVLDKLKQLANSGKTVLIVSHDKDVLNISDCCIELIK